MTMRQEMEDKETWRARTAKSPAGFYEILRSHVRFFRFCSFLPRVVFIVVVFINRFYVERQQKSEKTLKKSCRLQRSDLQTGDFYTPCSFLRLLARGMTLSYSHQDFR